MELNEEIKKKLLNKIKKTYDNGLHINFSNCDIICDGMAKIFRKRQTQLSDVFEVISKYYNNLEVGTDRPFIEIIDLRLNNIDTKSVLQYCLENADSFFSTTNVNPFKKLDLSYNNKDYFNNDDDDDNEYYSDDDKYYREYANILHKLFEKYPSLTIDLSFTQFDDIMNRYRNLSKHWDRVILKNTEELENRKKSDPVDELNKSWKKQINEYLLNKHYFDLYFEINKFNKN